MQLVKNQQSLIASQILDRLPVDGVWEALDAGVLFATNYAGPLHPRNARGQVAYLHTFAGLRAVLESCGWSLNPDCPDFCHFLHDDGDVGLVMVTGCAATGDLEQPGPRFRSRTRLKRPLVAANFRLLNGVPALPPMQLTAFADLPAQAPGRSDRLTAFLMVHRPAPSDVREGADPVRAEISLPVHMDGQRQGAWVGLNYVERMPLLRGVSMRPIQVTSENGQVALVDVDFVVEERDDE